MTFEMQMEALKILRPFLWDELEDAGCNWWNDTALPFISRRNQDRAWNMGARYFFRMDLADALKILMGNWNILENRYDIEPRYFRVICHLKEARDHQAHAHRPMPSQWISYDEMALNLLRPMVEEISASRLGLAKVGG